MVETQHDQLYDPGAVGAAGKAEHVGGPRHYEGQGLGPVVSWNCPACGKPNSRPLSEGCEFCHSGEGAAKHVGVDPIVRKGQKLPSTDQSTVRTVRTISPQKDHLCFGAFLMWIDQMTPRPTPEEQARLLPAFNAGWQAATTMQQPEDRSTEPPSPPDENEIPFEGTPESRTIVAALQLFKAQVLDEGPEEVGTGEWLGAAAIGELIEDVKRRYA